MEFFVQIVKQLPPVWPRVAVVVVIALLFFLPEVRRFLTHGGTGKKKLDRAKQLIEVRKLQIELADLKAKHPDDEGSILDAQIEAILSKPVDEEETAEPLAYFERAKFALAGSLSLVVIGSMTLGFMGKMTGTKLIQVALIDLVVALPLGLMAAAIPARARWASVFHGILVPALVGAVAVAAFGQR